MVISKIRRYTDNGIRGYFNELGFFCPGCKEIHLIRDNQTKIPEDNWRYPGVWTFNGDYNNPTIRASVLQHNFRKNPNTGKYDIEFNRCHSFITDGKIQLLSDCEHSLAGQTVELPELTEEQSS